MRPNNGKRAEWFQWHMRLLFFLTLLVTLPCVAGCAQLFGTGPVADPAGEQQTPSPPRANTASDWERLSRLAYERAREAGADELRSPVRISQRERVVEQTIPVEGGSCYLLALAWSFPHDTNATVRFLRDDAGHRPNGQLVSTGGRIEAPVGGVRFCADSSGTARISIRVIDEAQSIANHELLEYAVVLGRYREPEEDARARVEREQAHMAQLVQQRQANLRTADARDAQQREAHCRPCRDTYRACQVARSNAANPRRLRCENDLRECVRRVASRSYVRGPDALHVCGSIPQ